LRPRCRGAEAIRCAARTEPPVPHVAAVSEQTVVAQRTAHRQRGAPEAVVHGSAGGAEVLAHAGPTGAGDDGRGADRVADRPAQAATGNFHCLPPRLLGREMLAAASMAEGSAPE